MKNKEEPSIDLTRGNPSTPASRQISRQPQRMETTGSIVRQDGAAPASIEKPALSLLSASLIETASDQSNIARCKSHQGLWHRPKKLCRTAVCGPACTVVWGGWSAMAILTRFVPVSDVGATHRYLRGVTDRRGPRPPLRPLKPFGNR